MTRRFKADTDPHPVVTYYPRCSECRTPCVLRQCMTFGGGDLAAKWLWQRDCKHKKASFDVVAPDGQRRAERGPGGDAVKPRLTRRERKRLKRHAAEAVAQAHTIVEAAAKRTEEGLRRPTPEEVELWLKHSRGSWRR